MGKCILISALLLGLAAVGQSREFEPPSCDAATSVKPWSHTNPNMFYVCKDDKPVELPCPDGRGFLDNDDYLGCVPWEEWKCVKDAKPACTSPSELTTIFSHKDPNKFWVCDDVGKPIEVPCLPGKGFADTHEFYGCVSWDLWDQCS